MRRRCFLVIVIMMNLFFPHLGVGGGHGIYRWVFGLVM